MIGLSVYNYINKIIVNKVMVDNERIWLWEWHILLHYRCTVIINMNIHLNDKHVIEVTLLANNLFTFRITKPEKTTFHLLHLSLFREYLDWEFSPLKVHVTAVLFIIIIHTLSGWEVFIKRLGGMFFSFCFPLGLCNT